MLPNDSFSKKTIIFIDDHKSFIENVKKNIEHKTIQASGKQFSDEYEIIPEEIPADMKQNEKKEQFINIIKKYDFQSVWAVFVDIVLSDKNPEDRTGLEIASFIKEKYPFVPVLVYTSYGNEGDLAYASLRGHTVLHATVIPGVSKPGGVSLSLECFIDYVNYVRENIKANIRRWPSYLDTWNKSIPIKVWFEPKDQPENFAQISNPIILLTKMLFESEIPKGINSIRLSFIEPGYSGCHILLVIPEGNFKKWILKVDENPQKIEEEWSGYNLISVRDLPHGLLPAAKMPSPVMKISDNWWSAIALEYVEGYKTLMELFAGWTALQAKSFFDKLWSSDQGIGNLYAKQSKCEVNITEIVKEASIAEVQRELEHLAKYKQVIERKVPSYGRYSQQLSDMLKSERMLNKKIVITKSDIIHGDLNCRNILINPEDDKFVLIDFPHVKKGIFANDFAKAEVDLISIIMDFQSGLDIDLARLPAWVEMIEYLSVQQTVTEFQSPDDEIEKVMMSVLTIRNQCRIDELDYFASVLKHLLKTVTYRNVEVGKRILAVIYASLLLQKLLS
jgi:hypothetical protein